MITKKLKTQTSGGNSLLEITCKSNHSFSKFVRRIGVAVFNLFAKNLIADLNSEIHAERKRNPTVDDKEQQDDPVVMKAKKYKSNSKTMRLCYFI